MPVVTKEQLKTWFSNLKKPPEGEFWAWLDSYRHKLEKVPVDDVEGLTEKLQKKADLVNGVVPEDQLPFSVVTSEVITLGTVSIDDQLNLAVHSSGANKVRVKGKTITRTFPNSWNFTPIENNGVKVIRGYAVRNEDDFFISEGEELPEFTLPEIPEDALQLFIVTITQSGAIIDTGAVGGFKTKAESGWKSLVITSNNPRWITLTSDESMFEITEQNGAAPLISGLLTKGGKWIYPGKTYGLFNASGIDVKIQRNNVIPPSDPYQLANYLTFQTGTDVTLKPGEYFWFKIKGLELVVLKFGGSASFPEIGNDADILVKDTTVEGGVKWSNRLTNAENAINTETVNRALADGNLQGQINTNTTAISTLNSHKSSVVDKMLHYWDSTLGKWISSGVEVAGNAILKLKIINFGGYTIAQKNAIASPTEGMFIYQNEAPKGFQKYENGAWSAVGNNISTADLTNVSARTFTQGNAFTWNTSGFLYALKGLLDKTGNAAYTKVLVVHPTTGETVTRDFADPAATTLAVQNANVTQKTAMRTALLGTATPASPTISACFPSFVKRGINVTIDLSGLNLTLLDPSSIWIENGATKIFALSFSNINTTLITSTWNIPLSIPLGDYSIKIQNGVTSQGLSTGVITLVDNYNTIDLAVSNWRHIYGRDNGGVLFPINSSMNALNLVSKNFLQVYMPYSLPSVGGTADLVSGHLWITNNFIAKNKDYEIIINYEIFGNTTGAGGTSAWAIGLTTSNGSTITEITDVVVTGNITADMRSIFGQSNWNFNQLNRIQIVKTGSTVIAKLFDFNGNYIKQQSWILPDMSIDFAFYIREPWSAAYYLPRKYYFDIREKI